MSFEEELKQKQKDVSILTRQGDWYGSYVGYNELSKMKQDYLQERSKTLRMQLQVFCKANNITFDEFCLKNGIEKYYLEKVINGLIRPSEYFTQRILEMIKGE